MSQFGLAPASAAAPAATLACGVSGQPFWVNKASNVYVNIAWTCNGVYVRMLGYSNVVNKTKSFSSKDRTGGVTQMHFTGVGGRSGTRAVWECPVDFWFTGVPAFQVCTSISYV